MLAVVRVGVCKLGPDPEWERSRIDKR